MQNLPLPEVYEKEFAYIPWGILIREVEQIVLQQAPQNATVLDLMSGPGYLLGKLKEQHSDFVCTGIDLDSSYIEHAKKYYPEVRFINTDVFQWQTDRLFDVVLCTAGLHHVPYQQQEKLIEKISFLIKPEGFAIIADPYIDDYSNEQERKLAAAKLGYEYLIATIKNDAPSDVLCATANLIANDVLLIEYKNSIQKVKSMMEKFFQSVELHKTWPRMKSAYGDYYFLLQNDAFSS